MGTDILELESGGGDGILLESGGTDVILLEYVEVAATSNQGIMMMGVGS